MDAIVFQVVDNKPVIYTRGSCPGISDKCLKESIIKTYHDIWEDKYPGWSEPENPYNIDYTVVKERIDELVKVGIKEAYTENKVLYTEFIRDDSNNTSNTESDNAEKKDKDSNNLALKFDCSEAVVNAVAKPFMDKCMKMIVELLKNTPSEVALGLERVVFTGEDKQLIPFVKECLKYASVCRVRCLDKHSVIEEAQHYEGLELIGSTTTESQVKEWVEFENQKYSIVQDNQPRIFSGYTHKYDNENSIDIRMNLHSFVQPKLAGRPNQFTLKRDTPKPSHSKKGATASKLRKKPGINTQEGLAEADNTA
ncbi:hypothetical protein EV182_002760 [Spiromyces aspiralis]|uniref:Uncharacterized protein n=1 Tax=Spiromyces aspiralis TaxID=68401 RepID=A0ACC1HHU7_9FUNG|nr:hypothetical protein EV182_002760 [Spiromyces aspiralis]